MNNNLGDNLNKLTQAFNNRTIIGGSDEKSEEKKYNKLIIGFHTNKNGSSGIINPLKIDSMELKRHGFRPAAQIFTQVPQTSIFSKMESQDEIIKLLKENDLSLVIHSPYSINDFWKKNDLTKLHKSLKNAELFVEAEALISDDSNTDDRFKGIVVHLPKLIPEDVVNVIKNRQHTSVPILLENHAYKPGVDSYELPSKLNKLSKLLDEAKTPNWGFCIDTAHLFVCISDEDRKNGYRVEERSCMERWLSELTNAARSHIRCWHLNGSVNPASSHDDKHSIPVFGTDHLLSTHVPDKMWGELLMKDEIIADGLDKHLNDQIESLQDSSLIPVLKHAMTHNIPVILEINRGNDNDITNCLKMFKRLESEIINNPNF